MNKYSKANYFMYTRVSDDAYKTSLDDQAELLLDLAEKEKIDKANIVIIKEDQSWAKSWDRTKFEEMMRELEYDADKASKSKNYRKKYKGIMFWKTDRLARNHEDFWRLERLLDAWYEFISYSEKIENTYTWRLLFRMLSAFAIYESEKLSARMSFAKANAFMKQRFDKMWAKNLPFGYEWVYKKDSKWKKTNEKERITVNQEKAKLINRLYSLYIVIRWWNKSQKNKIYKPIIERLRKREINLLISHINKNSDENTNQTVESLINNIVTNNTAVSYTWIISYNFEIKDDLLKTYFQWLLDNQKESENFIENNLVRWEAEIGESIELSFYFDYLQIVSDELYDDKKRLMSSQREKSDMSDMISIFQRTKQNIYKDTYSVFYVRTKNTNRLLKSSFSHKDIAMNEWYQERLWNKWTWRHSKETWGISYQVNQWKVLKAIYKKLNKPKKIEDKIKTKLEKMLFGHIEKSYKKSLNRLKRQSNMYSVIKEWLLTKLNLEIKEINELKGMDDVTKSTFITKDEHAEYKRQYDKYMKKEIEIDKKILNEKENIQRTVTIYTWLLYKETFDSEIYKRKDRISRLSMRVQMQILVKSITYIPQRNNNKPTTNWSTIEVQWSLVAQVIFGVDKQSVLRI